MADWLRLLEPGNTLIFNFHSGLALIYALKRERGDGCEAIEIKAFLESLESRLKGSTMGKWGIHWEKEAESASPRELYCMTLCVPKQHRVVSIKGLPDARLWKKDRIQT